MGVVARATHEGGGRVVGVIPKRLRTREIAYEGADELIETATMTERKEVMIHRSDAFVVLPGGFGTLDELIETVTLYHLGYHNKPTILINVAGFFDPVLALFEHFYATNVAYPRYADAYHVVQTPGEALSLLGT
ncbi:MAG: TIGR00730 family Rossman fold protein, partial [Bacteroidota bacterium]